MSSPIHSSLPFVPLHSPSVCFLCFLFMTVDAHTDHPLQPPNPPTFNVNHPPMTPIRSPASLYTACRNSSTKASSRLTSSCARKTGAGLSSTSRKAAGGASRACEGGTRRPWAKTWAPRRYSLCCSLFYLRTTSRGSKARERERRCRRSHCCCIRRHRRTGSTSSCRFVGHIPTWRGRARRVECRPRAWRCIECRRSSGEEFLTLDGCHEELEGEERGVIFQG